MQRLRFRAVVTRCGRTRGRKAWQKDTLLLRNVVATSNDLPQKIHTDHIWLKVGKQLQCLAPKPGQLVEFDARVRWYRKLGGWDLRLSHHTRFEKAGMAVRRG